MQSSTRRESAVPADSHNGPWATVHARDLVVGDALPWDIFTRAGQLLAAKGFVVATLDARDRLIDAKVVRKGGAERDAPSDSGEGGAAEEVMFAELKDPLKGLTGVVEGAQISLRLPGDTEPRRISTDYVGRVGQSVVVLTATPIGGNRSWTHAEGLAVGVKLMSGRSVWQFQSRLMAYTGRPVGLLHLQYPVEATSKKIRASSRLETMVLGTAQVAGGEPVKCVIRDLSAGGAAIELDYQLGDLGLGIELSFELSSGAGNAAMKVPAVLRSTARGARRAVRYGVEFQPSAEGRRQLALIIRSYLYELAMEQAEA